ncbi:MAG: AEC family transporter [Mobilicoccus sp.]|nr:AEC family transporter [Mobilicoccus sp.]
MIAALTDVILPVLLVAAVGFVLARRFPLDTLTMTKLGLYATTPALAFEAMMTTQLDPTVGMRLVLAYLLATVVVAVASWLVTWRWPGRTRRAVIACTILGNNGNFGLPIALLTLGHEGLQMAIVIFIVSVVVMYTAGPLIFGSSGGVLGGLRAVATLPVAWAIALAGLFRALNFTLPTGVMSGIDLLGQAAIPLVLLQLGAQIAASRGIVRSAPVITAVALRTILVPLAVVGAAFALGLTGLAFASLLLAAVMPIAVNSLILAREYDGDVETVASAVLISTLLAIPLLAALIPLLAHLPA